MQPRRIARGIALQALYEIDCVGHEPNTVMEARLLDTPLKTNVAQFAESLVYSVLSNMKRMDDLIARYAPEWPVEQMALVDRNVLRIAIYELAVDGKTPVKVAINEAVELAKLYGSESSARFVNGVLGTLADRLEALRQELGETH
jgi:N utilization substance protein B